MGKESRDALFPETFGKCYWNGAESQLIQSAPKYQINTEIKMDSTQQMDSKQQIKVD